jgi:cAMP-dependent protein kinase regulator
MAEAPRQYEERAVQLLVSGQPEVALADYDQLAEAWARQGWVLRAIALCKVLLQLEPGHQPTQRLLEELYSRRDEAPLPPGRAPKPVESAPVTREGPPGEEESSRASLFSRLGQKALQSVLEALEPRVFQRGELILEQGQPGSSMFAIVEGSVEVVKTLKSGRRRTVALLGEGDFFGEMALLSDMPRLASIRAFERTAVLELSRERLEWIVQQHPNVGEVLRAFFRERLLENALRDHPLNRALPPSVREALAQDFQVCTKSPGEVLLVEGQPADALYLLVRGRCRVLRRQPDGSERLLQTWGEGEVFGEGSLMQGLPATETVCADTPCLLLRLERERCEQYLVQQPELREVLSRLAAERLQRSATAAPEDE